MSTDTKNTAAHNEGEGLQTSDAATTASNVPGLESGEGSASTPDGKKAGTTSKAAAKAAPAESNTADAATADAAADASQKAAVAGPDAGSKTRAQTGAKSGSKANKTGAATKGTTGTTTSTADGKAIDATATVPLNEAAGAAAAGAAAGVKEVVTTTGSDAEQKSVYTGEAPMSNEDRYAASQGRNILDHKVPDGDVLGGRGIQALAQDTSNPIGPTGSVPTGAKHAAVKELDALAKPNLQAIEKAEDAAGSDIAAGNPT